MSNKTDRRLQGKKIAFLTANEGVERVELERPWQAVKAAGGSPELLAPKLGSVQSFDHLDKSATFPVTTTTAFARAEDYDAVALPGGVANPDQLRLDDAALELLGEFHAAGKPMAVICHGPWTLLEAGLVRDRTLTSWPSLQTDIRNAGGNWIDKELVIDDGLVSSRKPDDLDAFCEALVERFADGRPAHQGAS